MQRSEFDFSTKMKLYDKSMKFQFAIRDLLLLQLFGLLSLVCFRLCFVFMGSRWTTKAIPVTLYFAIGFIFLGAGLTTVAIQPITNRVVMFLVLCCGALILLLKVLFSYIL